jgi:hypothetical protein
MPKPRWYDLTDEERARVAQERADLERMASEVPLIAAAIRARVRKTLDGSKNGTYNVDT